MLVVPRCFYLVGSHVQTKSRLAAENDSGSDGTLIQANKRSAKTVQSHLLGGGTTDQSLSEN
jgi:hypothetical protein